MLSKEKEIQLTNQACEIRQETLKSIASIGSGHIGGSLSIAEVLAVLYGEVMRINPKEPRWQDRDRLVVSKGHSGPAVYSALALHGYFDKELLYTLNKPGTHLPSHCDMQKTTGIDMTTGSLGQGASSAMGIAVALKYDKKDNFVYLVLGDGECQEGQVWEAALFAAQQKLDNVIAFVDFNGLQVDGEINCICSLGDIAGKFDRFGWNSQEVNGHSVTEIYDAIEKAKLVNGKPSVIILHTKKGRGISDLEGKAACHSTVITKEQLSNWLKELEAVKI